MEQGIFGIQLPETLVIILVLLSVGFLISYHIKKKGRSFFINLNSTPNLDHFCKDLTKLAAENSLDPVIGREDEIGWLTRILSRRTKNNAVLIGNAGVGKTSIVEGLAIRIAMRKTTPDLQRKRILALDLNALIAGTKYRGEFESRVKMISEEISNAQRKIILFVDEIHNLVEVESSGESISIGDIFKPAMARGELQIVGATTSQEFGEYFNKDPALKRRLQPIYIGEPDEAETLKILQGIKKKYEEYHQVSISDEALRACVRAGKKILPDRSFPDKAIDIMDEAASEAKIANANKNSKERKKIPVVSSREILKVAEAYGK